VCCQQQMALRCWALEERRRGTVLDHTAGKDGTLALVGFKIWSSSEDELSRIGELRNKKKSRRNCAKTFARHCWDRQSFRPETWSVLSCHKREVCKQLEASKTEVASRVQKTR
jgi:hypothetical protein